MAVMIPKRPFRSPRRASLLGGKRAVPRPRSKDEDTAESGH
jgi:hypothetical protein